MWPLDVVEADPIFDNPFGLEPVLQFMQVYGLLFQGPPQPFDEDVIEIPAATIHQYFDVSLSQSADPGCTRELRP